jgi:hypothetical protein
MTFVDSRFTHLIVGGSLYVVLSRLIRIRRIMAPWGHLRVYKILVSSSRSLGRG